MTHAWPFGAMRPVGYSVIMADPPWLYRLFSDNGMAKSPQAQYACMPTDEICALPVNQLAAKDAWLWLWGTFPMIADALRVMGAWGFRYCTGGPWVKRGDTGKLSMGPGYVLRGNAEMILLGKVGNPPTFSRSIRNVLEAPQAPRGRHSEKPDEAYERAEILFGPATRADLFSRRTRPGWDAWGLEAGALDDPATVVAKRPPPPRLIAPHPGQGSLFGFDA